MRRLGFGLVVFFLTVVVLASVSHAEFTASWKKSVSLDAKPAVSRSLSLGTYSLADRPEPSASKSSGGISGLAGPELSLGTSRSNHPARKSGLFGFSDWRDQVNSAAGDMGEGSSGGDQGGLDSKFTFGLGQILSLDFGWPKYARDNQFMGCRGIGVGYPYIIGFYSKNYFNPPKKHAWNGFWQWGTWYLIIPWVGFGAEYTWDKAYFEIGTFYIIPYPGFGIHF